MSPDIFHPHIPRKVALATAGAVIFVAELTAAANSGATSQQKQPDCIPYHDITTVSFGSQESIPPCPKPTPNAILIPLAHPRPGDVIPIPLAPVRSPLPNPQS
jgi:hypothetical protein